MPLVTAVIPVYNHERYVVESIKSLLRQPYGNIELIIINDGSNDRSHEMILSCIDECKRRFVRFEYINRENTGLSATLNEALGMARGVYFTALASDDIALPDKIEVLVNTLEAQGPTYAAAFGDALFIDDNGQQVQLDQKEQVCLDNNPTTFATYLDFRTLHGTVLDYRSNDFGSYTTLLSHNYLPAMSNIVRTELIRQVDGWTNGNASEDWEMWRKLSKMYKFAYVDRPLACYRWHTSNSVKAISHKLKLASFSLVTKEKQYCAQNQLIPSWRQAYVSLLIPVLLDNRIGWREKLSAWDFAETSPVSLMLGKRLAYKAMKTIKHQLGT
jgi:alpha-1,3-rhamnosyltransferase